MIHNFEKYFIQKKTVLISLVDRQTCDVGFNSCDLKNTKIEKKCNVNLIKANFFKRNKNDCGKPTLILRS